MKKGAALKQQRMTRFGVSLDEVLDAPPNRSNLAERARAIEAFIANRGPITQGLSDRERKRAHGTDHRHGEVRIYR